MEQKRGRGRPAYQPNQKDRGIVESLTGFGFTVDHVARLLMTKTGGTLLGFPVIASTNVPATGGSPADGYALIFAIADEIMLADDGNTVIDASDQASIQMDTAPDSPPSASTPVVSFWQMNFVGLRAERWINWQKRRTQAVQYMAGTKYAE